MDTEKYKAIASAMSQAFGVSFVPSSRGVPDLHAITVPQEVPSTVSETAALSTSTSKASPEREVLTVDEAALKQAQFSRNEDLASELIQSWKTRLSGVMSPLIMMRRGHASFF